MIYLYERNYGCRISDNYMYKGLRVVFLENEYLRIGILIDKGSDIFEFLYKPKDVDYMFRSPIGIRNPYRSGESNFSSEGRFMDYYEGGWQELFPNIGGDCIYKGAQLGFHGEVCYRPWESNIVENNISKVSLKLKVKTTRTPFVLEKIITLKKEEPIVYFEERIKNESYSEIYFTWGHHPTFGSPFVGDDVVVDVPNNLVSFVMENNDYSDKKIYDLNKDYGWPKFKGNDGKILDFSRFPSKKNYLTEDQICLSNLEEGWYGITNLRKKVGFGMVWDKNIFKDIWMWRVYGKNCDQYPYFGKYYNFAIEIWSSFGYNLNHAIKQNTQLSLGGEGELSTEFMAIAYESENRIKRIDKNGQVEK